ncbi:MAG: CPBP family intramembrane metalloprotease [Leptolyngbyaceae cyanobacterium SL_5_9]|nr:CPBP family intramembrane metalloprotease [Leptolyngbyaceae cyanobacterium SL_5_9]
MQNFEHNSEYPKLSSGVYWAASIIFYGWGEEIGWRGVALPYLQTDQTTLAATVQLNLFWTLWHLPLFRFTPGLSQMGIAEVLGWYFSLLTEAILFTWLINSTHGSIFIAAIFHGTVDIAFVSPTSLMTKTVLGALIALWGIAVLCMMKPHFLFHVGKLVIVPETNTVRTED